ncbi:MAG: hypothetical protein JWL85_267 [Candidatus Saccharibacteria bacterium]|nr:hypothetical protein [Candidatus Saccharibacteria bacterium]
MSSPEQAGGQHHEQHESYTPPQGTLEERYVGINKAARDPRQPDAAWFPTDVTDEVILILKDIEAFEVTQDEYAGEVLVRVIEAKEVGGPHPSVIIVGLLSRPVPAKIEQHYYWIVKDSETSAYCFSRLPIDFVDTDKPVGTVKPEDIIHKVEAVIVEDVQPEKNHPLHDALSQTTPDDILMLERLQSVLEARIT